MNWFMIRNFFTVTGKVNKKMALFLGSILFVVVIVAYFHESAARLAENPNDKLFPSISTMVDTVQKYVSEPTRRTGELRFWVDTVASLKRLIIGVFCSAVIALFIGLNAGLFPWFRATTMPFITVLSLISPMAILPILFVFLGVGEVAKISLICIGTVFLITRAIYLEVRNTPKEQIMKAMSLGASQFAIAYRIVLPQILPKLIDNVRISLGPAWIFLIASEGMSATQGLGYRIFLVRRYMSMDVIYPYVLWMTLIGLIMDFAFRFYVKKYYPWYHGQNG